MKSHSIKELANVVSPLRFGYLLCYGCHVATPLSPDLNGSMSSPLGQPSREPCMLLEV